MDKDNIKQGFANETVATLTCGGRILRIDYNRKNDTYELLEKCRYYDYLLITGDIFKVVNHLLDIYNNSIN